MPQIKESDQSEELRAELRKQGYKIYWDVREALTRISYWNNGLGKSLLVLEYATEIRLKRAGRFGHGPVPTQRGPLVGEYEWASWDIYRQLCTDNNIAKTYAALAEFTKADQ